MEKEVLLSIYGITKTFPGVKALDKVDLEVVKGEIHALVGENGAGKSTLMNIISGVFQADGGKMSLAGRPFLPANPRDAQDRGIGFVHQEMALCPHLSVAENVFLGRVPERSLALVDFKEAGKLTAELLRDFHLELNPSQPIKELNIAAQQVVEIVKALSLDCRLLILDEPTSSLTENETEALFAIIEKLRARGISVLYISHRLAEVFRICDRVSVFRDGKYIATKKTSETTPDEIIAMMVGRNIDKLFPAKAAIRGEELLRVEKLSRQGKFRDVSFAVYAGEILGFAGLVGAGRTEVARAVCGIDPHDRGDVFLEERLVNFDSYAHSIAAKVVYVTEDRKSQGLFLQMPLVQNISVAIMGQITEAFLINQQKEMAVADDFVQRLRIKTPSVQQLVVNLSGGNQQKVMLGKWLATHPKIVFMDEPTRGIDVGAKAEIHALLRDLSNQGIGVVLISSELPEIIGMCDRVLVMREGAINGELVGAAITEKNIMRYAALRNDSLAV